MSPLSTTWWVCLRALASESQTERERWLFGEREGGCVCHGAHAPVHLKTKHFFFFFGSSLELNLLDIHELWQHEQSSKLFSFSQRMCHQKVNLGPDGSNGLIFACDTSVFVFQMFFACSILGTIFYGYFFSFHLLHMALMNQLLQRVILAVTRNGRTSLQLFLYQPCTVLMKSVCPSLAMIGHPLSYFFTSHA